MSRPHLQYLSVDDLVAQAGGDPWSIDESLQAGSPAQINFLAQAFHTAAGSATAAEGAFRTAGEHFAQYNRENGEQPINNAAQVARVKDELHATNEQLGRIAADLAGIAAALAQARAASQANTALNANLIVLDARIGGCLSQGQNHDAEIAQARRLALADTETALHNATTIRSGYSQHLRKALAALQDTGGYDAGAAVRRYSAEGQPAAGTDEGQRDGTSANGRAAGDEPTPAADAAPAGADGGAGGAPRTPEGGATQGVDGGPGAEPPWLAPGTPVMTRPLGPPPAPSKAAEIEGKWGNVGDGLSAAGSQAKAPWVRPDLPAFAPGGTPTPAVPGGVPVSQAMDSAEKFGKRLGVAGNLVTAVNGVTEFNNDLDNGVPWTTAAVDVVPKTVGDITGGLVGAGLGAETGAQLGAVVGTFFGPGPGTAIGAVLGAGAGAAVGGFVGSEFGKDVGEGISNVWHGLVG
ncbi:hypothetical protein [Mycolicibacter hiberniae]|uniref:Predicted hydrolase N-terminal domain-containing protein n=1 Tax=Mycolicibacter hiberniae TaxID=29314 RepID=A0A7I7WZN5_9MYCO|nr:hypothetical protein [Mycolicibacter hiberniae]MCV7086431.1 hypothetical protein [Mycolicibacter hiberniae]ORV70048.1 hypothetical protein AWC09_11685 [Mycolicibacter hiberniae]BBZ22003.1 hypothetical protein MHIB_04210 [Mycolicibacter hiberniae]